MVEKLLKCWSRLIIYKIKIVDREQNQGIMNYSIDTFEVCMAKDIEQTKGRSYLCFIDAVCNHVCIYLPAQCIFQFQPLIWGRCGAPVAVGENVCYFSKSIVVLPFVSIMHTYLKALMHIINVFHNHEYKHTCIPET